MSGNSGINPGSLLKIAENKEKASIFIEASSWFRLELNQRHADFQSTALPTELQNHFGVPIIDYFFPFVKGKENITVIFLKKLLNLQVLDGTLSVLHGKCYGGVVFL